MNRLHHLVETLRENIPLLATMGDAELVLLNYGSTDGMHEWCMANLSRHMDSGLVRYFVTREPIYFVHPHAKNIAHRMALGDILVNLDADNYILEGYVKFLKECFSKGDCILASPTFDACGNPGCFGKIAVKKNFFCGVGGYDESIDYGWGWEDNHLINRMMWKYGLPVVVCDPSLCRTIFHSDEERVRHCKVKDMKSNMEETKSRLHELSLKKEYVANKGVNWGWAKDLDGALSQDQDLAYG